MQAEPGTLNSFLSEKVTSTKRQQPPTLSFSPPPCYHGSILSNGGETMKHILKLLLWLPALLWYRVIWGFSAQTAAVSGDLSDRLL